MGRENKLSIIGQAKQELDKRLAIGESKHLAKIQGTSQNHIYSWSTYKSYLKHSCEFVKWTKENYNTKTLEDARRHVDDYIKSREHLSKYTQKLDACALAKLYNCSSKDFIKTGVRNRENISRSRGERVRDKHFSVERNKTLVNFCKSVGLRRSELKTLKGNQLIEKEGNFYIGVTGKGGRYREAPIVTEYKNTVIDMMKTSGDKRVFEKIHNGADIHSYRAEYATTIYNSHCRDKNDIPKNERYCCRNDMKGIWLDKIAMKISSNALGHNRISIIAGHYLRLEENE